MGQVTPSCGDDNQRRQTPGAVIAFQTFRAETEAMATSFELCFSGEDQEYLRGAAVTMSQEIHRLESLLSRFMEGSDIYQLNHLQSGDSLRISDECHSCLKIAGEMSGLTSGIFDITVGRFREPESRRQTFDGMLRIDPDSPVVICERAGINLDLGAIGKGFALDHVADLLGEWGIDNYYLDAGGSSVLAGQSHQGGWEARLMGETMRWPARMRQIALGASGTSVKGDHLVDPRNGDRKYFHRRTWAFAKSAAVADALSTAAMLMSHEEIVQMTRRGSISMMIVTEPLEGQRWEVISSEDAKEWRTDIFETEQPIVSHTAPRTEGRV